MPYIQPGSGNYFGFQPVDNASGRPGQVNFYGVSSSEAGAILPGDVVAFTTVGPLGVRVITGTYTGMILGVSAGTLAANAGSTAATLTLNSSQLIPIYDSPTQIYVVNDTTSFLMSSTALGKSVAVLATGTASAQSTVAGRSIMAIAANTASSAGGPFKIIGIHPIEGIWPSGLSSQAALTGVSSDVRKWLVQPSNHVFGALDNRGVVTT